jgi:hypothetical protein
LHRPCIGVSSRCKLEVWEKNTNEVMIREDLECSKDISKGLRIFVRRVKSKDLKEADGEETLPDVYSDSLDSVEVLASRETNSVCLALEYTITA